MKHLVTVCLSTMIFQVTSIVASNHFAGITVSNSVAGVSTYTCRTQEQWNEVAAAVRNNGFKSLRIVGFDCNALEKASAAAAKEGLSVLAGLYIPSSVHANTAATDKDLVAFREAIKKYGQGRFVSLTIGNEVNDNPAAISSEVQRARAMLRSWGILTHVSTAHTWIQYRDNPVLCQGDFVAVNAHAFFDGHTAESAGNFLEDVAIPAVKKACPGKKIIISETGWPSRGAAHGSSGASPSAERKALAALNCASKRDPHVSVYAFEYDDQAWKSNDNERSFGVFGKFSLENVLASC